jgi:hypothetical protein
MSPLKAHETCRYMRLKTAIVKMALRATLRRPSKAQPRIKELSEGCHPG